jgi:hypothetical protein
VQMNARMACGRASRSSHRAYGRLTKLGSNRNYFRYVGEPLACSMICWSPRDERPLVQLTDLL